VSGGSQRFARGVNPRGAKYRHKPRQVFDRAIWRLIDHNTAPTSFFFSSSVRKCLPDYFEQSILLAGKRLHLFFGRLSVSQPLTLGGVNYAYSTWHTCCISWHTIC